MFCHAMNMREFLLKAGFTLWHFSAGNVAKVSPENEFHRFAEIRFTRAVCEHFESP